MLLHSNQAEAEVELSSVHTGAPVRSHLHGVYVCAKEEEDLQV